MEGELFATSKEDQENAKKLKEKMKFDHFKSLM